MLLGDSIFTFIGSFSHYLEKHSWHKYRVTFPAAADLLSNMVDVKAASANNRTVTDPQASATTVLSEFHAHGRQQCIHLCEDIFYEHHLSVIKFEVWLNS